MKKILLIFILLLISSQITLATFTALDHSDLQITDGGGIIVDSSEYVTIFIGSKNVSKNRILIPKGSGNIIKVTNGASTTMSMKILLDTTVVLDQEIVEVDGVGDSKVFNVPMVLVNVSLGEHDIIVQIKESGSGGINITDFEISMDSLDTVTNGTVIHSHKIIDVQFTNTSFQNIGNIILNKTILSSTFIDVNHYIEKTSGGTAEVQCYFQNNQTNEVTTKYYGFLGASNQRTSTGVPHVQQTQTSTPERWDLFCKADVSDTIFNNVSIHMWQTIDNNSDEILTYFNTSSNILVGSGTTEILRLTNITPMYNGQLDNLIGVYIQSTSGAQTGVNSPRIFFNTTSTIGDNCTLGYVRSLDSNNDVGAIKIHGDCSTVTINESINISVFVSVSVGETLRILNVTLAGYEVNQINISIGEVPPFPTVTLSDLDIFVLTYPRFFGVNETENVGVTNGDETTVRTVLILDQQIVNFSTSDNITHTINVLSTEERDLEYTVEILLNETQEERDNNGDTTVETILSINDDSNYGYIFTHTLDGIEAINGQAEICPYIRVDSGTPTLRAFSIITLTNGTLQIDYGDIRSTQHKTLDSFCLSTTISQKENRNAPYNNTIGFQCTNCDATTTISLGLDTNSTITNTSTKITNINNTGTIITTSNYMFTTLLLNQEEEQDFKGTWEFRVPFYLNISLFNTRNTTFQTSFDYIYLKKKNPTILTGDLSNTRMSEFGAEASRLMTFGLFDSTTMVTDLDVVHWGVVVGDTAVIKLYEKSNYTITLLTVKTFMSGWSHEFIKPQYTKSKIETKLDSKLLVEDEVNRNVDIWLSEYEANKSGYYVNIVKWIVAMVFLLGAIFIAIISGYPQSLAILIPIWLLLIKLLGLSIIS